MNSNKLNKNSRIILLLCAILLIIVLFVPMWSIELNAPQYPEGLGISIYANKLGGNIDIINGLNHYIGMKTLHEKDFVEFIILPYCIVFFSIFCLVAAMVGRKKLLYTLLIVFISFGIIAMADFWRWEYNYGHELNPDAAIKVPGMSYQPPLIGYKQLLNFGAYSIPDTGGWIFIIVGILLLFISLETFKNIKNKQGLKATINKSSLPIIFLVTNLFSCNNFQQKINLGKDVCAFCKMIVSDNRYGAVLISPKGKAYIFDDEQCLISYVKRNKITIANPNTLYFTNYSEDHLLLNAEKSFIVQSKKLHGPMNGLFAAFSNKDSANSYIKLNTGSLITLKEMIQ
jgi:copper chaperone NosL